MLFSSLSDFGLVWLAYFAF